MHRATSETAQYHPGRIATQIDTSKPLAVSGLHRNLWGPIDRAYPEIARIGNEASFKGKREVMIYPPEYVSGRLLKLLANSEGLHRKVYPLWGRNAHENRILVAVIVHATDAVGNYHQVYILRLKTS